MLWTSVIVFVAGFSLVAADYARYAAFVEQQAKNETFVRLFNEHLTQFQDKSQNLKGSATFTCKPYLHPATETTSVHQLRPMDVKVIAALGDSITAGTGITAGTILGLLREDRGLSWSVGGDETIDSQTTLPNMLKTYSPDIHGYSKGWGPVWLESSSHLNVANPGDKSEDMPSQAVKLVDRMKKEQGVNFDQDWKVITLFVGGNDLCDFCSDKTKYSAENYVGHIQTALDYLHANVPRAFVNLVEILDISIVKKLNQNFVCDTLHLFLCDCAAFPKDSAAEAELQAETARYRELMNQLVLSGRYDTRDDFTVVVQPFFRETLPPDNNGEPDLSYFAPDCFHLSLKGHRAATDALWNNMVEPVGNKRTQWTPNELVECPSAEAPYFYTYKNSGPSNKLGDNLGQGEGQMNFEMYNEQKPDPTDTNQSGSATVAIAAVATVAGVIVLIAGVILGRKAWKRNQRNKEEREILLKPQLMYNGPRNI